MVRLRSTSWRNSITEPTSLANASGAQIVRCACRATSLRFKRRSLACRRLVGGANPVIFFLRWVVFSSELKQLAADPLERLYLVAEANMLNDGP